MFWRNSQTVKKDYFIDLFCVLSIPKAAPSQSIVVVW